MISIILKVLIIALFARAAVKEMNHAVGKEWWLNLFTFVVIAVIIIVI